VQLMADIGDNLLRSPDWGPGVFGTEGDPGCPSGGDFRDDLSSGRKADFGRIWNGGCC